MPRKKKEPQQDGEPAAEVVDINEVREEIEGIRREALTYGFSLDADKPIGELRKAIAKIREERQGKPPCYRRSYLATAPQCRICDLAHDCAKPDEVPAYLPPEDLMVVQCDRCKQGTLIVELTDPATGSVRNYGCTTAGCPQTLTDQQRFKVPKKTRPAQYHEKTDEETGIKTRKAIKMPTDELDNEIVNVVRDRGLVTTKQAIVRLVPAARPRIQRRIDVLVRQGRLRFQKKKGYSIPVK